MSADTETKTTTTTKTRRPGAVAGLAVLAVAAALVGVGVGIGRGTVPSAPQAAAQPAPEATTAPSTPGAASPAASTAAPVRTPTAAAPTMAVYGNTGLAAQYARQLGHESLSAACEAGIDWTCGVTKIEPSGYGSPGSRTVSTTITPWDGDAAAQKWLELSPPSVSTIKVNYAGGVIAQEVGTATRETEQEAGQ